MTSIIKVDEIQNKAGTTTLDAGKLPNMLSGSAKSWVHFTGTGTIAIDDSFNTASLTDRGTGAYSQNFSSNMSNASYSAVISGRVDESYINAGGLNTVALCACGCSNSSGSAQDAADLCLSIDGDLA